MGHQYQMKIVDALTFNKELDLLEGRLEYLYNHVEYFLIVESNYTHTGKEKPLYFAENASRFAKYADKILPCRLIVDKNYDFTDSWKLENQQRDFISLCLDSFDANDVIMVSDADEIPDRSQFANLRELMKSNNIVRFNQRMFYYNLSTRLASFPTWGASYAAKKHYLNAKTANGLRMGCREETDGAINAGWHLTYFMAPEQIKNKLESFAHSVYNTDYYKDLVRIQACIEERRDLFDREDHEFEEVDPDTYFPEEFLEVFDKWK
jgi:beta-1,4-mannosyl-glycoprotein beta-1,4-N-acetylglucosaminyltransferase